jgi:hypothetical protein
MTDVFTWSVAYRNGDIVHEFDEERPDGRGWAEIGEKPVKIVMLATQYGELDRIHHIAVPQDAQPVFFRRRYVTINAGEQESNSTGCLAHCIGWKRGDGAVYLFVLENGSTLLTDNLQAI